MLSFFEPCQGKSDPWENFFGAQPQGSYLARRGNPLADLEFTSSCLFSDRRQLAPAGDQVGENRDHAFGWRIRGRLLEILESLVGQT